MNQNDRRIVLFTAGSHGLVHTYELSIPILMTIWLVEFSVTAAVLGVVVTLGYGLFGVGALPGGILVDQFGSKPLIVASLLGMAASFVLASASPTFLTLAVAIALWGVAASVYHPAGLSLISKGVSSPGVAYGYHGIGGNLGIGLGPLVTVLLLLQFGWRTVALALAVPTVLVVTYGLAVDLDETAGIDHTKTVDDGETKGQLTVTAITTNTRALFTVAFSLVFVVVLLSGLYYRAFLTFLPDLLSDLLGGLVDIQLFSEGSQYAEEFDVSRYLYVAILMVGVVGQYLGGRLADRFDPVRALSTALGVLAVLAVLFVPAVAVGLLPFLAVALFLGIALFTIQPLQQATVASYSSQETRGLSFGYTFLAIFGVGALGAGLAGTVLTYADVGVLFVVLAVIAGSGSALAFAVRRIDR
ncbi:MFS family permease [Halalkaliarchaeum sp. AArc-CO]|uniref:MFS transporter n=1 Tax=unclassified Halalkaliarchaeum TaxID=2678344 RepID=UPI00217E903E|nr:MULTISPECIES: MFS transporter [unclassified Halalkaliarchaeum]MDR5671838.1 MFS transporter [Halalkaliarchaeum sp. AArc-GB]UWG51341.1 MFS family permease [Halalkaliarchaeum sp. AArc-CO]